ncbi:PilZ domain-containing protein [Simiduia curdlanivorans]|uniref:PilZ domain-containing protein n=1 Tax=Simiduia curdlanivorans TaxID=1492769 RepID=A0ABV8V7U3_9GAMM|nr:PilZ domain-containing protein [Simiduia curdlanivorans]MDN3640670.1 PilZ domain-containing protein [Simiduia curdlanivorans]
MTDNKPPLPRQADTDKRQEYRMDEAFTVFIELPSAEPGSDSEIVVTTSLDISANGLRVISHQPLLEGSILSTCIQQRKGDGAAKKFFLVCEIKWCRPYGAKGEYLLGLSLFEAEGSSIADWKEFVALSLDSDDQPCE